MRHEMWTSLPLRTSTSNDPNLPPGPLSEDEVWHTRSIAHPLRPYFLLNGETFHRSVQVPGSRSSLEEFLRTDNTLKPPVTSGGPWIHRWWHQSFSPASRTKERTTTQGLLVHPVRGPIRGVSNSWSSMGVKTREGHILFYKRDTRSTLSKSQSTEDTP